MLANAQPLANASYLNPGTMLHSQALGSLGSMLQPQMAPLGFDPSAATMGSMGAMGAMGSMGTLGKEFGLAGLYPGGTLPGATIPALPKDKPGMTTTPAAGYYAYPSTAAFGQNMLFAGQVAQPLKRTLSE